MCSMKTLPHNGLSTVTVIRARIINGIIDRYTHADHASCRDVNNGMNFKISGRAEMR